MLGVYGPLTGAPGRGGGHENPKGRLQELFQASDGDHAVRYEVVAIAGADHERSSKWWFSSTTGRSAAAAAPRRSRRRGGRPRGVGGDRAGAGFNLARPTAARTKWTGVCPPARAAVVAEFIRAVPAPVWIAVTEDLKAAEQLADEAAFFLRAAGAAEAPPQVLIFPESIADSPDMREAFAASSDRLKVLSRLRGMRGRADRRGRGAFVATTPAALLQPVPALEALAERE